MKFTSIIDDTLANDRMFSYVILTCENFEEIIIDSDDILELGVMADPEPNEEYYSTMLQDFWILLRKTSETEGFYEDLLKKSIVYADIYRDTGLDMEFAVPWQEDVSTGKNDLQNVNAMDEAYYICVSKHRSIDMEGGISL